MCLHFSSILEIWFYLMHTIIHAVDTERSSSICIYLVSFTSYFFISLKIILIIGKFSILLCKGKFRHLSFVHNYFKLRFCLPLIIIKQKRLLIIYFYC